MKKAIATCCAALVAALPVMAETIPYDQVKKFNGNVKATADGFQIVKRCWMLGTKRIKFEPEAKYKISVELKIDAADAEKARVNIGFHPMCQGQVISGQEVFFVPGSDTELAAPVKPGDTVITVKDAFKWSSGNSTLVVFDCDPSGKLRDLPNRNSLGFIKSVNRSKNEITLAKPAKVALDAGTAVRQHQATWSFLGNVKCPVATEWQTFTMTTVPGVAAGVRDNPRYKMWPKGDALVPVISTMTPLQFRNLTVEVIKEDAAK
ncbi:MAG: hypothetical protein MR051_06715 [Lentisphaeria bacterium]|nr:hypothetical protein [Lentisphaeria bacterium]